MTYKVGEGPAAEMLDKPMLFLPKADTTHLEDRASAYRGSASGPSAIEEQHCRALPRQQGTGDPCHHHFLRSTTQHRRDRGPDRRRALAGGLVEPNDHVAVVQMLVDVPRTAVPV